MASVLRCSFYYRDGHLTFSDFRAPARELSAELADCEASSSIQQPLLLYILSTFYYSIQHDNRLSDSMRLYARRGTDFYRFSLSPLLSLLRSLYALSFSLSLSVLILSFSLFLSHFAFRFYSSTVSPRQAIHIEYALTLIFFSPLSTLTQLTVNS